jgi:lipopolysaccharide transport system ATP-binding protein
MRYNMPREQTVTGIAVKAEGLGKRYVIGERGDAYANLRDSLSTRFRLRQERGHKPTREEFWALKDISFEVRQGEVLGVVGRNGAGKSTLLKLISRITEPTTGRAEIHGRVGSLLEVGTGFHPELTGRENIFLNGAILGMTRREIALQFDEITAFAEVEKFLDTPVKRYSSGMYVRLAFAVAAHLQPEILIVDEVLAVGDAAFQQKCLGKMSEVAHSGRTVIFVSHNINAVRQLTTRSLLINEGRLVASGPSAEIVGLYLNSAMDWSTSVYQVEHIPRRNRELSGAVRFVSLELESHPAKLVPANAGLDLRLTVRGAETVERFRFQVTLYWMGGREVGTLIGPESHSIRAGELATFGLNMSDLRLAPGRYYCAVSVGRGDGYLQRIDFDAVSDVLHFEVLSAESAGAQSQWRMEWGPIRFATPEVRRIDETGVASGALEERHPGA